MSISRLSFFTALLAVLLNSPYLHASKYPPTINGATQVTYKQVDGIDLYSWIFTVKGETPSPALVFYFGGGWAGGNPAQFVRYAKQLQANGIASMLVDYRVRNRHHTKVAHAVSDAKSAMNWLYQNAERYQIDKNKIGAAGASAGGQLAAATVLLPEHGDMDFIPSVLVLFNPVTIMAPEPNLYQPTHWTEDWAGSPLRSLSPYHHLSESLPPTVIYHGTDDTTVAFSTAEAFCQKAALLQRECRVLPFQGKGHGFFNGRQYRESIIADLLPFLGAQGWL
ncbi:alpha/beta hydrolase [Photobacterium satsumensis]|uniref:alpha/beta hydrolase n=1 Tax=Photobacterium satsumensis TaxID=2910239 RepID=UPI003D113F8F